MRLHMTIKQQVGLRFSETTHTILRTQQSQGVQVVI